MSNNKLFERGQGGDKTKSKAFGLLKKEGGGGGGGANKERDNENKFGPRWPVTPPILLNPPLICYQD